MITTGGGGGSGGEGFGLGGVGGGVGGVGDGSGGLGGGGGCGKFHLQRKLRLVVHVSRMTCVPLLPSEIDP